MTKQSLQEKTLKLLMTWGWTAPLIAGFAFFILLTNEYCRLPT